MTQPTPGFEFPADKRNIIDRQLREFVAKDMPLESVRPERRNGPPPIVVPVDESNASAAIMSHPYAASQVAPAAQDKPAAPRTVPVKDATPTPMADPEAISIDLPSRFHYYDFKDLYVKPFRVFHLAKLAKANETGSLQAIAEAMSSVLSTSSGDNTNLAFRLSLADFNAVLYWLRLNSFTKKQMRITSHCNNPAHQHRVSTKELPEESLKITTLYTNSDIKFTYLEKVPDPDYYKVQIDGRDIALRSETLTQVIQFLDSDKWQDPEFQYSARIAAVLDLPGMTIEERVALVNGRMDPDQALIALEFADLLDEHGVQESVKTNCMECGASGTVQIVVDAPSFLSPEF